MGLGAMWPGSTARLVSNLESFEYSEILLLLFSLEDFTYQP